MNRAGKLAVKVFSPLVGTPVQKWAIAHHFAHYSCPTRDTFTKASQYPKPVVFAVDLIFRQSTPPKFHLISHRECHLYLLDQVSLAMHQV
jgi:hypothetical protein